MNIPYNMEKKSLVLIGFMGVGKTTIGQLVAQKTYRDFIDIDEEIENEYNIPTTEIFKQFGEKEFRQKEKDYVRHYCTQPLQVISLGGGAFMQDEIRNNCLTNSIVCYLDISWHSWKNRFFEIIDNHSRPILQGKSLEEIETLFNERKPTYEQHHIKVMTDSLTPEEITDQIVESLKF